MIVHETPPLTGLHHLSLTVSELEVSVPWYTRALGFVVLGEDDHAGGRTVVLGQRESNLTLLLQEHNAHEGSTFSEHRPGLDHLSFRVPDRAALDAWSAHFDRAGVDHAPVLEEAYGSVLVFRDPDRIRLELFADPPRDVVA